MKHRYIADGSNRLSDPRPPSARRAHDADADRRHRRSLPALGGGPDPQAGRERSGARVRGAPRSPADRERHPRVRRRPHLASALSRRVRPADPADPGGPRMPPRRRAGLVRAQGGLAEHGDAGCSHLRHPAADRGRHPDDDDHRARHGEGDHCASPSGRGAGAEAAQGGDSMIELARRMSCVQASAIREILKVTERADVLSFARGLPAPDAIPAGALARAHADVLANDAAAALQYGPTEGFGPLRAWVAERMTGRGLPAAPGQVLITAGSQQGIDLVGKTLIDPGDTGVVEAPSYLAALQSFSTYEARFETVPSDDEGMQVDALERVLFFFQAEDGIRDKLVTGVQTCALPI